MDNYDLRSEVNSKSHTYYVQSNLVPAQASVVTSLFHEGRLLSRQVEPYDPSLAPDAVRRITRELHEEKKNRIQSLLTIREKLKKADDHRAHLKLSEALYNQSLYREAMAEVVHAVKLGAEESRAFSILGNSLVALGDYDKAIKSFKKGIDLSPDYPDLHNDLGCAYIQVKKCRLAVDAFERAVDLNKYYHDAYLNMALALCLNVVTKEDFELSKGLRKRVADILAKTLQLKPSLDTDAFRAAQEAVLSERFDIAYERLAGIKEGMTSSAENHLSLDLYLILKFNSEDLSEDDIDRYIERTRRALDTNPGYADLQNDLGVLYTAKCKLYIDKAREAFDQALRTNRNFRKAQKNLKLTENDGQGIHFLLKALLD